MINFSRMKNLIERQKHADNMAGRDSGGHFGVDRHRLKALTEWRDLYHAPPTEGESASPHRTTCGGPTPVNLLCVSLVHMVRYGVSTVLEKQPCHQVMRGWDVLSCSLLNYRTGFPEAFGSVGLAIRVSPQNIVGTHPIDVGFPNHIGAGYSRMPHGPARIAEAALLSEAIRYSVTKVGYYTDLTGGSIGLTEIVKPSRLLAISNGSRCNEVLVLGRPCVNVHGIYRKVARPDAVFIKSATEEITVRFIIIYPGGWKFHKTQYSYLGVQRYYQDCWAQASRLRAVNPQLAIKVAQIRAPEWDWDACAGRQARDGFI